MFENSVRHFDVAARLGVSLLTIIRLEWPSASGLVRVQAGIAFLLTRRILTHLSLKNYKL